jgi:hypothetical protein
VRARFGAVGAQEQNRADHAPYIAAVRRGIEARDIRVTDVQVVTSEGRREATLTLRPDEDAFAERLPREASASWDEDNGWSMLVCHESITSHVHKGLDVVPDPEDVAAWAVVLLAHPELTPSYEDHPFRDHSGTDPEFEAQLARYAPGS